MLNLVVAFLPEAQPLIAHFGLRPEHGAPGFPLYSGKTARLVISGPGKVAAAAACAQIAGLCSAGGREHPAAFLNVGIAGHGSKSPGTPLLAHKITDPAAGRQYYPAFAFEPGCGTSPLITVEQPELGYPDASAAYDMEAAGFYPTACRFSTAELVHCMKIVSDNPEHPADKLDRRSVPGLIEAELDTIASLAEQLRELAASLGQRMKEPPWLGDFIRRWRFSQTEQIRLRRLLGQWALFHPDSSPLEDERLNGQKKGAHVLRALREQIDAASLRF